MAHDVSVVDVLARPTAVVAATTTWPEFPWCSARGLALSRTRWEVYGPHDDPAQVWTEVYWLLSSSA